MEDLEKKREEATRKCYITYLNAYKEKNNFRKLIQTLESNNNKNKFISYLMFYIKNYVRPNINKTYTIIEKILFFDNKEECFKYLDETSFDKKVLSQKINHYLVEYRPDIVFNEEEYDKTFKAIKKLLSEYELKNYKPKELKTDYDKARYNIARKYILLYLDSKYTAERFCMQQRIGKSQFDKESSSYVSTIKVFDVDLYKKYLTANEERNFDKENRIKNDISKILNYIKANLEESKMMDIYSLTIYGPNEILEVARKILEYDDLVLLSNNLNEYKGSYFGTNASYLTDSKISGFINTPYSITMDNETVELTKEDRENIILKWSSCYLYNN